jgi:hypothetical protein
MKQRLWHASGMRTQWRGLPGVSFRSLHSTPGYRSLNPLGSFTPVMLDSDLALLYGVTTGNFNKAVQRNAARFPVEFSFVLTPKEFTNLLFQIGISRGP